MNNTQDVTEMNTTPLCKLTLSVSRAQLNILYIWFTKVVNSTLVSQ